MANQVEKISTLQLLQQKLSGVDDEMLRIFELKVTEFVMKEEERDRSIGQIIDDLKRALEEPDSLEQEEHEIDIKYAAFWALATYYRRKKQSEEMNELVARYREQFKNHPTFDFLESMALKLAYKGSKDESYERYEILEKSKNAYNALLKYEKQGKQGNVGIIHNYVEAVAVVYEYALENRETIEVETIQEAVITMEKLIKSLELKKRYGEGIYPKFYCTYGRVLSLVEKYDEAIVAIRKAIDKESPEETDYMMRIGDYQHHMLMVKYLKHTKRLEAAEKDIYEKIEGANIKNLEFLGFFVAIISFIIGSIQIIQGQSFEETAKLIGILMASVTAAFSGFGIILHGVQKKTWTSVVMLVISIFMAGVLYFI